MPKTYQIEDIRNKLTPVTNLLALLEEVKSTTKEADKLWVFIEKEIAQIKTNVKYLTE